MQQLINQDFCNYLEYQLNDVFQHLDNVETKGFWCDGILLSEPDDHYSKDFVSKYRQVKLKAFVGKTGQTEYTLTLKFGRKALSRYARGLEVNTCIREYSTKCVKVEMV